MEGEVERVAIRLRRLRRQDGAGSDTPPRAVPPDEADRELRQVRVADLVPGDVVLVGLGTCRVRQVEPAGSNVEVEIEHLSTGRRTRKVWPGRAMIHVRGRGGR